MGKYQLLKHQPSQYYWNLRADNGERILQSEMYNSKGAAIGGISSCRENSPLDERYIRFKSVDEQHTFSLKAKNGERIGRGETYRTEQGREVGIASVKANGPNSPVDDETGER